jgi:hypothetical protein
LYGGKVLARIGRHLWPRSPSGDPEESPRLRLWQDPAVQSLLQPSRMLSTQLLDPKGLQHFLERSREKDFAFSGQWSMLVTLECTLQRLKEVTSGLNAEVSVAEQRIGP